MLAVPLPYPGSLTICLRNLAGHFRRRLCDHRDLDLALIQVYWMDPQGSVARLRTGFEFHSPSCVGFCLF
jgi:hypothetical protein